MKPMPITVIAFALSLSGADAQTGPGWIELFDGKTVGDWSTIGDTNWRVEDGALVADKRTSQGSAYLLTKEKYKDFAIYIEFWVSDDANSGIMFRCSVPANVGDRTCYEANINDRRSDPTYGTGAIVHHAEVNPMPRSAGKWNTMEITANGRHLLVTMDGQKTAEVRNGLFVEGPIGLQHGSGTLKVRKLAIKPM